MTHMDYDNFDIKPTLVCNLFVIYITLGNVVNVSYIWEDVLPKEWYIQHETTAIWLYNLKWFMIPERLNDVNINGLNYFTWIASQITIPKLFCV